MEEELTQEDLEYIQSEGFTEADLRYIRIEEWYRGWKPENFKK